MGATSPPRCVRGPRPSPRRRPGGFRHRRPRCAVAGPDPRPSGPTAGLPFVAPGDRCADPPPWTARRAVATRRAIPPSRHAARPDPAAAVTAGALRVARLQARHRAGPRRPSAATLAPRAGQRSEPVSPPPGAPAPPPGPRPRGRRRAADDVAGRQRRLEPAAARSSPGSAGSPARRRAIGSSASASAAAIVASGSASSASPSRSASATSPPTTWWAARNGTPRRTRASATAVAVVYPSSAAAPHRRPVHGQRRDHAGHDVERRLQRGARLEERRLVLLEVALVGQRQALEQRQEPGQRADHAGGPAPHQLGRIRVLLVRHHRRAGREGVRRPHEPEARVRPPRDLLGQAREVDHRQGAGEQQLGHEVPVARRVERVRRHAVEAELPGGRLAVERVARARPGRPSRAG